MHFVPYHELSDRPNLIVDGAANEHTQIVLSHWPQSGTEASLRADTSAEIVFNFLDVRRSAGVDAASNNHFDEDGLIGLYALLHPAEAMAMRELLCDAARAGDFGTYRHRQAARLSFVIAAFADPDTSPLDAAIWSLPYPERAAELYRSLLPRLHELAHVERYEALYRREDELLSSSEAALSRGQIRIEERPEIDLAIVRIDETRRAAPVHRFTQRRSELYHPMAIHNATERCRVLIVNGRHYELQLRYETWVQYASRKTMPRVDLSPLASALDDAEGAPRWSFEGVEQITPRLRCGAEESAIEPDRFVAIVERYLRGARPAWDPYAPAT
jgi:hypothetical protein